jgi:predicted N-acyltransferase
MHCEVHNSIAEIPASQWDALFDSEYPFTRHAFLLAMEMSGCATAETGWIAQQLVLKNGDEPVAAMPLYAKNNSYGEFVFDWGWAEAYQRHGLDYYPKLVTAVPFSPVAGPRVGLANGADEEEVLRALLSAIHQLSQRHGFSSWHLLFPGSRLRDALLDLHDEGAFLHREAVQFHWFNRDYTSFDGFLAGLRSSRRKNLKRERRKVLEQGIHIERKIGADISERDWAGFFRCYQATYLKRSGHSGYLNAQFFKQLGETMPDQLMMVVASREDDIAACSLFLYDRNRLYGRYWGALQEVSCLHFEACFYQGIEFCIEKGIQEFDPGTQGEHKLMRGFEPVKSASYHWIASQPFRGAIAEFLSHEKRSTEVYRQQAGSYLPYRKDQN